MSWREEKTLFVLTFFIVLFIAIVLGLVIKLPQEAGIQTFFVGLLGGAWSSLMLYLKLEKPAPPATKTNPPAANPAPFEGGGL